MRRLWKVNAALAVALGAVALASAAELPHTPSYGTGVFFDEGKTLTAGDFSVITEGEMTSVVKDRSPGGTSIAEATATAERFGLGILLVDNVVGRMAGAQAASGYTVKGLPEGAVVLGLRFSIAGKAFARDTGAVNVTLTALDYRGNFLAEITFTGERIVVELWGSTDSTIELDFRDAVTLTGSPPDGVVVTLSTGQIFGSTK